MAETMAQEPTPAMADGERGGSLMAEATLVYTAADGVTAALNDGVNPSWDGNVFTTYGGGIKQVELLK